MFNHRYSMPSATKSEKRRWEKVRTKFILNSEFFKCEVCELDKCPYKNYREIEGGSHVCLIEQEEFYHLRKLFTADYNLSQSDLATLDMMLMSIVRLKRIRRYLAQKEMEGKIPNFNPKTGETIYSKQMRLLNLHMDKINRSIREWLHTMKFARKERLIDSRKKKDIVLELTDGKK